MAKDVEVGGEFQARDYHDPPPAPLMDPQELTQWSFYRAIIAEFIATLLFLYITVLTVIGYKSQVDPDKGGQDCDGVGILGISWAFGGMIFILVYCTAGISASSKLSGSLSTNKQNKSLIASVERYKSLTLLNLGGLSLEFSPELELSSEVSSWIGAGEGGGVMFCGRSTTCDGVISCSSTKYGKKS
ncbi:hypothetical protein V6N11_039593 [Hibiscus sabdariffa]|uniref:Uncharacterized protein n=1 Tax=Hibiscus sabdariffa TaxID=183260 RepID=A0ABR2SNQ9_9ROSI